VRARLLPAAGAADVAAAAATTTITAATDTLTIVSTFARIRLHSAAHTGTDTGTEADTDADAAGNLFAAVAAQVDLLTVALSAFSNALMPLFRGAGACDGCVDASSGARVTRCTRRGRPPSTQFAKT